MSSKARGLADLGNQVDDGAITGSNMVVNGACTVSQRGTSVTGVTGAGYRTVDRFLFAPSGIGTWTVDQATDGPDGFINSFKVTCTTANASPPTNSNLSILYRMEGQDLQSLAYGTSSAKTITMSFWVKSNKTGNASFEIQQDDNNDKQVTPQYTINSANTWEYKTIVIEGDTSGVINNDVGMGFNIRWWLNSGSAFIGGAHQTSYVAEVNTDRNVSNLGVGGTVGDYFQITGVCLNVGDSAIDFPHDESYGETLAKCQRYYEQLEYVSGIIFGVGYNESTSSARGIINFATTKRAAPTVTQNGASNFANVSTGNTAAANSLTFDNSSIYNTRYICTSSNTALLDGGASNLQRYQNTPIIKIDAEL